MSTRTPLFHARGGISLAAALVVLCCASPELLAQRGRAGVGARGGSVRHSGPRPATSLRPSTVPGARLPGGYGSVRHSARVQGGNRVPTVGARDVRPQLPDGASKVEFGGKNYYRAGNSVYQQRTIAGQPQFQGVRPPIGWWSPALPDCPRWRWRNRWVYYYDDRYWEESEKGGESGYVVVEDLPGDPAESESGKDPALYLTRSSEFLARFDKISVEVNETMDELNEDGMEVELSAKRRVWMQRPAAMKVDSNGDRGRRYAYFDGQALTIYDPATKEYGVAPIDGDIDRMLDTAAEKYGTVLPLADILSSSMVDSLTSHQPEGTYLGQARVRNYPCDHLAFVGEEVDFEIWIETGERPVPRKFDITYKKHPGKPRYEAELYRWDMTARVSDRDFEFRPPEGATRIDALPGETAHFAGPETPPE